ncbi:MAG: GDSL-type esterase/lipase family protein [Myxococcota bacterium]
MSPSAPSRWRARIDMLTGEGRWRALLAAGAVVGLGAYWSCATSIPPETIAVNGAESPSAPEPAAEASGTDPEPTPTDEEPPLLPVLNKEALTARLAAQQSLLGKDLFEDAQGKPIPWITPQDEIPGGGDGPGSSSADDTLLDSLPGSSGLGGTDGASTGRVINGNALGLFVPIEAPPGGESPLSNFYAALEDLRAGNDPDGKVRVLVYGGSHTDADVYTQYLRRYLQQRFGDGGHGFVQVAKPWRWYRHVDYRVEGAKYWKTEHAQRRSGRMDGLYGLMGCSLAAKNKRAFGRVIPRGESVGAEYDLLFLRQPKGGSFKLLADGKVLKTIKTRADAFEPGHHRFTLPEGQHEIEIDLIGNGEVRVFGMTIEREQPGVVIDTLGIGGTRAANMLNWNEEIWADNVKARDPNLVVMFYGTNEATDADQPIRKYERDLREVLKRFSTMAPQASCLLMGPGDFPRKDEEGRWHNRQRIDDIIEVQRRVAAEHGCGFWDTKAFMGGELSMTRWAAAQPPMAKQDHIHFTKRGYVRIGMALVDAMMVEFDGGSLTD